MGADGVCEQGCPICWRNGGYARDMALAGVHLPDCFLGLALELDGRRARQAGNGERAVTRAGDG